MLNEGSEPQPWCPPGLSSVSELDVVTAGKNLLDIPDTQKITDYGGTYTFTLGDDGSVTCSPTVEQRAWSYKAANVKMLLSVGTYTLSLSISDYVSGCGIRAYKSDETLITQLGLVDETYVFGSFTLDAPTEVGIIYKIATAKGYPQLEFGPTATAYEPPSVTTTAIDLDGHQLRSLPDGTCDKLVWDETGAVSVEQAVMSYTATGEEGVNYIADSHECVFIVSGVGDNVNSESTDTALCDKLPKTTTTQNTTGFSFLRNAIHFMVKDVITDAASAKQWLAQNKPTFVLPMATPQSVPLAPATMPALPESTANVWAACDPPTEVSMECYVYGE